MATAQVSNTFFFLKDSSWVVQSRLMGFNIVFIPKVFSSFVSDLNLPRPHSGVFVLLLHLDM